MTKTEEHLILINLIGILESISCGSISIDESERLFFSPRAVYKLKKYNCNKKIIAIVEEGCELEDIEALIPNELPNTLSDLKNRALGLLKEREITIHEVPTDAGFEYVMGKPESLGNEL